MSTTPYSLYVVLPFHVSYITIAPIRIAVSDMPAPLLPTVFTSGPHSLVSLFLTRVPSSCTCSDFVYFTPFALSWPSREQQPHLLTLNETNPNRLPHTSSFPYYFPPQSKTDQPSTSSRGPFSHISPPAPTLPLHPTLRFATRIIADNLSRDIDTSFSVQCLLFFTIDAVVYAVIITAPRAPTVDTYATPYLLSQWQPTNHPSI